MDSEEFKEEQRRREAQHNRWWAEMQVTLARIEERAKLLRTSRRDEPEPPTTASEPES